MCLIYQKEDSFANMAKGGSAMVHAKFGLRKCKLANKQIMTVAKWLYKIFY